MSIHFRHRAFSLGEQRRQIVAEALVAAFEALHDAAPIDAARPRTRGECENDERPCPWVSCRHHLYLDFISDSGSLLVNFPNLQPWELRETCSLDVARDGGATLDEVGELLNLTSERARQIEVSALLKLRIKEER